LPVASANADDDDYPCLHWQLATDNWQLIQTMIPVEFAIQRVRRDITFGVMLKGAFFAAVFGCLLIGPAHLKAMALTAVGFIWVWLSVTSARTSRLAADSPGLIAAGQFDEAERRIDLAMRTFSLFRNVKLQTLHQLALLRHAQHRWQDSAALSRALLRQRPGSARALSRESRLILAESLLELNDLSGTYEAMASLYQERLPLRDAVALLTVQLDYEARIGAWQRMMNDAPAKAQLAELMSANRAALTQALLALAAKKSGRQDFADWLGARAALLADIQSLCERRPMLCEVWGVSPGAPDRQPLQG
jgi:hypothetical protein